MWNMLSFGELFAYKCCYFMWLTVIQVNYIYNINYFESININFEVDESIFCSEHESKINQRFCFVPHDDINLQ